MSAGAPSRSPRLNPFLFPSDTDFRFVLLVVAVIGASTFLYSMLHQSIFSARWQQTMAGCLETARKSLPSGGFNPTSPEYQNREFEQAHAYNMCMKPLSRHETVWILSGVGILLVVAVVIYWLLPQWLIWRNQLVPFTAEDDPEIMASLIGLCQQATLERAPAFLQNPLNPARTGLAFGRRGRYCVLLNGGLIADFYRDRSRFMAVVRHELAHLKNADVDKTYFAIAISLAFAVVGLVPTALLFLLAWSRWGNLVILGMLARTVCLTGFVYLMLAAVLRTREIFADVRASVWDGPGGALRKTLAKGIRVRRNKWPAAFSFHPDVIQRLQALDATPRLFGLTIWDAIAAGITAAISFSEVRFLFGLFLDIQIEHLAVFGASLLFAPLIVGSIGLGIWRSTFALKARGEAIRGAGRLGVGVGIGLAIGVSSGFTSALMAGEPASWQSQIASTLADMAWFVVLSLGLFFFFKWVAAGSSIWLETITSMNSLQRTRRIGLTIASVLLAIWLGMIYYFWSSAGALLDPLMSVTMGLMSIPVGGLPAIWGPAIGWPMLFGVFICLWAYPLTAWLWRRPQVVVKDAWLDPGSPPLTLEPLADLDPRRALAIGVLAAVLCVGFMAVIRIPLHLMVSENTRLSPQWLTGFRISQLALAILVQLIVAAVTAIVVKRAGWAHGLLAAFVAGCLISAGYVALVELGDCLPIFALGAQASCTDIFDPDLIKLFFGDALYWGMLVSLPVSLIASAIGSWLRKG